MKLEDLRNKIDEVDARIVELISERLQITEEIGKGKQEHNQLVEDIAREQQVLENVKSIARAGNINQEDVAGIYRQIMAAAKRVQGVVGVAFQGENGAYSEEAASHFFGPSIRTRPSESFGDVFRAVESGEEHFGIVPVENSLEGSINQVYDLLLESGLRVCGETELRVSHCLISTPESGLDSIKRVYSHPQALAQCRSFLKHLGCEVIPTDDTAGSVLMIKEKGTPDNAAIAGARAAEIYGMKVVTREIEDNLHNFTRFFILSREDSLPSGDDKTSLVFSVKDRPGVLYQSLSIFASQNISLTKLESRPTRQKPWEYNFYLDLEGHRQDKEVSEALEGLEKQTVFLKILGSYPRAR
ncbi:prephenate dehydratase [Chloroflexota bacterium]